MKVPQARLIALWRAGKTGGQIADETGMTRGAMLGRLHRAGELGNVSAVERAHRMTIGWLSAKTGRRGLANGALSFGA